MKNKNYLSDQIRNNIPKRNIEEGRESVRMFVEMLKKRKINVIDEAILNRAYEEEDYVDEKMLGLVLKALKIDEPVQYIPRYIRNMNAFHANGTKVVVVVSGEGKAEIAKKAFFGPVTPKVPASVLQLHNDVTVIMCK